MSLQRNENRGKALEELEAHRKELEEKLSNVLDEISQHTGSTENGTTHHKSPYHSSIHSASMHNKSGYLYKWQDRTIGWSGTKWDLRWVRLESGRLAYYKSHNDQAPRYVLTLKRCAIRDDGCKVNRRYRRRSGDEPDYQTPGAFYHVFSIYQRPENTTADDSAENDQEEDIVPLLRFSTTSNAEKMQWMEMLSEACAYCDSNEFLHEKDSTRSTNEQFFQYKEKPIASHGTLPPMYFAPPMPPKLKRMPSNHKMAKTSSYVKLNKHKDASKSNPKRKSEYPPSKPMHRTSEPSYLSNEAAIQNYRGILNLGLIILFISNFRLMLATMSEHGFVLSGSLSPRGVVRSWASGDFMSFPLVSGLCLLNVFVLYAYVIELCTSRLVWNENVGNFLHVLNIIACFVIPCMLVWYLEKSPIIGACLLITSMVLWMKLISYAHANADYRKNPERTSNGAKAMIQDLDENYKEVKYPENVTLSNIYYFWFAPTLTYQIAFPHLPRRRSLLRIVKLTLSLFVTGVVILFLIAQVIRPSLTHMMQQLEEETDENRFSIHIIAEYLLKLAMASTYVWLLVFYGFFHVFLNLLAEITKFGDRVFYRDWWNSSDVSTYWRLWNLPVHYWLIRHLYFPCIRKGLNKNTSMFAVFFFSAVMHELLISIPFHMVRYWSFLGMMAQIPLVFITKYLQKIRPGSSLGNILFWITFCIVGQPMAILMYTIDFWKLESNLRAEQVEARMVCKNFLFFKRCDEL